MEILQDIINRRESFLKEAPRKHTILVENMRGDIAALFASDSPDLSGIAIQFVDDVLCYVFNNDPRWKEIGQYDTQSEFFKIKNSYYVSKRS